MHNVMKLDSALDRRRKTKRELKAEKKEYEKAQRAVLKLKDETLKMFDDYDSNENSYSSKNSDKSIDKS